MKSLLHYFGGLLCLAGVIFVGMRLKTYAHQVALSHFDLTDCLIFGLFAMVYGAANLLLARAWWHLLSFFEVETAWIWAVKTYGLSQLARYVPGNIFHLAGRQALGMAAGLGARPLAKSAMWELGLITISGTLFGVLAAPIIWPGIPMFISSAIFLAMIAALYFTLRYCFSPAIGAAMIWQMVFLAISGTVFIGILWITIPETSSLPTLPVLCGAYVFAWLAGLVTPGAPAGVGVREMVLLFLLGDQIAQADLLLTIVLGRGVTVLGDILYFMISTLQAKEQMFKSNP